ncbi:MAG: D-aminoacyl-tRNA deacylase [Acidobacteriota bacterium]|nr:D-aminoacyl-tRNA deacylase [Acidobacteriota bacterium]
MRVVIQRVSMAEVEVQGRTVGRIGPGLAVLVAVCAGDTDRDLAFIRKKILQLRIFPDEAGRMNRSLLETGHSILLVSQFTLYGDCRKGNRPSFSRAAPPTAAREVYRRLAESLREPGVVVETGRFGAMMDLSLVNDGPVTLIVDSRKDVY